LISGDNDTAGFKVQALTAAVIHIADCPASMERTMLQAMDR
jgi:succinyl-CoA synthetase alpha subunit